MNERESTAIRRARRDWNQVVASALVRTEVPRAVARLVPRQLPAAQSVVETVDLLPLFDELLEQAAMLAPPTLRTLDAIHLASALLLGEELDSLVTYDAHLADAARAHGLQVQSPGS